MDGYLLRDALPLERNLVRAGTSKKFSFSYGLQPLEGYQLLTDCRRKGFTSLTCAAYAMRMESQYLMFSIAPFHGRFGVGWLGNLALIGFPLQICPTFLHAWKTMSQSPKGNCIWRLVPIAVCWSIWMKKNNRDLLRPCIKSLIGSRKKPFGRFSFVRAVQIFSLGI